MMREICAPVPDEPPAVDISVFSEYYPKQVAEEIEYSTEIGESPYGPADPITEDIVEKYLSKGGDYLGQTALRLLDVGGGDGEKHTIPPALLGHVATNLDVDKRPLWFTRKKVEHDPELDRNVRTVLGNAEQMDEEDKELLGMNDISVNVGYIYLAPEPTVRNIFRNTSSLLNPKWGATVIQFNTNIRRFNEEGEPRRGANEQSYTHEDGLKLILSLLKENGFDKPEFRDSKLDHEGRGLRSKADVLIAAAERW
jgi:hypothetical protein